jgi:hypothetical protein
MYGNHDTHIAPLQASIAGLSLGALSGPSQAPVNLVDILVRCALIYKLLVFALIRAELGTVEKCSSIIFMLILLSPNCIHFLTSLQLTNTSTLSQRSILITTQTTTHVPK